MERILLNTNLPIGKRHSGKVRDIYNLNPYLLIITTDRVSAFDVVLEDAIPCKGHVLKRTSVLWLKRLSDIIPNHFLTDNVADYPDVCQPYAETLRGRSMLVKKAKPLPVECVVRGYITGSGWKSYQQNGTVCGITLPAGLVESQKLPGPIFTPTTKESSGHDQPITFMQMVDLIGYELASKTRDASLQLYLEGARLAEQADIIIADTKFEFGLDENGDVILTDEVLTPDSSRFWPADKYAAGRAQESFDKQFLRDYLLSTNWDQTPPAPKLPEEVIQKTFDKYMEAFMKLSKVLN